MKVENILTNYIGSYFPLEYLSSFFCCCTDAVLGCVCGLT